ncbi:MerR family transcriptional regulator [Methylobacterium sp. A54F]
MGVTIRELSERAGVKVPTIRYYERQGLLPVPQRSSRGRRAYEAVDIARLCFVRFSRGLGLEIDEIRALIEMVGEGNSEEIDAFAEAILDRLGRMNRFCAALRTVAGAVRAGECDEAGAFKRLADEEGSTEPNTESAIKGSEPEVPSAPPKPKRKRASS